MEEERSIQGEIHMIIKGSSGLAEPPKVKRSRLEDEQEEAIIFIEHDAEDVLAPYNDVIVVIANITDFNVHHVLLIMEVR